MTDQAKVNELLNKIDDLEDRKHETRKALDRSLAIQMLWPEVEWPATSRVRGNPYKGYIFTITCNTGEQREFDILDVPEILWPEKLDWGKASKRVRALPQQPGA